MAQIHCNFFSYSLGYGVDILIVLPSFSPCDMRKGTPTHKIPYKYPVLYLLHGHGNDYMSWSRFTSMERYVEERRIAVVTCSVGNKGYMNADAYGENYYDFVARELPEFIIANFPVSARTEDTYVAGLSMGGYGTLAHGFGHPESYCAIGAFSPATEWKSDTELRLGHGFPKMMDLYAQLEINLEQKKKFPAIFLCVGKQDFLYESVIRFHRYLEKKEIVHRFDEVDGYEHEWAFWDFELPQFLDWLPRTDQYANYPTHKM